VRGKELMHIATSFVHMIVQDCCMLMMLICCNAHPTSDALHPVLLVTIFSLLYLPEHLNLFYRFLLFIGF